MKSNTIPLSLYIHIPWCVKKCPYCDFNSHALKNQLPEQEYLDALIADLQIDLPLAQGREIKTIFFGGGTPSLISPKGIANLLQRVASLITLATDIEITLEVNPGTVEHHSLAEYRASGVNRISLGAQSFNDDKLQALGRIHKAENTIAVIEQIQQANFHSYNIDLMHGLPQQTVAEAILDLQTALQFKPPHLSWYQLTLEPNTIFYKYPPKLPDDEITWEIQIQGEEILKAAGMQHYEVSAFTQPNHACRHNINYWKFGDYLGIGAGAHSKITNLETFVIQRIWKNRNPKDYLDYTKSFLAGSRILSPAELPSEYMLNRLRLFQGFDLNEYQLATGLPIESIAEIIDKTCSKGLITVHNNMLNLTTLGTRFLNDTMQMFLMDEVRHD